jgi:hypothetical protein
VDGIIIDPSHAGEIQSECHGRSIHFTTLLEAFQYCDPKGMGVASDEKRVSRVQRKFKKEYGGACKAIIPITAEGGGRINFPAFVEWAQSNGIALPLDYPLQLPVSHFRQLGRDRKMTALGIAASLSKMQSCLMNCSSCSTSVTKGSGQEIAKGQASIVSQTSIALSLLCEVRITKIGVLTMPKDFIY